MHCRTDAFYIVLLVSLIAHLPVNGATGKVRDIEVGETNLNAVTWQSAAADPQWHVHFKPSNMTAHMDTNVEIQVEITNINAANLNDIMFRFHSENSDLAQVNDIVRGSQFDPITQKWQGNITIQVIFLGFTRIHVHMINERENITEISKESFPLIIIRKQRIIDHVFTGSVALLVSLLYINFGAALDVTVLKGLIVKPVGPSIGFFSQFVLMPLISYAVGYFVFSESVEMQLGLFFTGVSPSGGASNIWSVILGGNINLSVLMTTVSNIAAFGMMPLWIFTLGHLIFERGNMAIPYKNIATFAIALIVPLAIGLAIQKCSQRLTRILVRFLKPISTCLILFIIIFAIVTNLYMFKLFSWKIILAGLLLPWLGYMFAWILAKILRQNPADGLTIAIETGIQNTGIAIFLLRSLPQPQADLTTVIPVAVAIMTPFPLMALYLYNKCTGHNIKDGSYLTSENISEYRHQQQQEQPHQQ
ncbi:hepatic sodium/bile acid cotransporter-like [Musca vetustissima]|uniref:hepatic sodium/bile acid cotransporter-like n=1 Tax=Musca vetustissima TaxID=27455 RepID=UPI002AB5EAB7|nr:hepatic sodium/bile acid cotransporter-like [Musca vetustissima]